MFIILYNSGEKEQRELPASPINLSIDFSYPKPSLKQRTHDIVDNIEESNKGTNFMRSLTQRKVFFFHNFCSDDY